jgi:hypothetical protein
VDDLLVAEVEHDEAAVHGATAVDLGDGHIGVGAVELDPPGQSEEAMISSIDSSTQSSISFIIAGSC